MRSVFVYLRNAQYEAVAELLGRLCPAQRGPPWVWKRDGDPCLYINVDDDNLTADLEPEAHDAIMAALGPEPAVLVTADIPGRHPGDAEVRALLSALLQAYPGFAQDDYSLHQWTLEEVLSGQEINGHPFFDYSGWSKRLNALARSDDPGT